MTFVDAIGAVVFIGIVVIIMMAARRT